MPLPTVAPRLQHELLDRPALNSQPPRTQPLQQLLRTAENASEASAVRSSAPTLTHILREALLEQRTHDPVPIPVRMNAIVPQLRFELTRRAP